MKFQKLEKKTYAAMEHQIIDYWKSNKTFEKSVNNRSAKKAYVFYDGPPFITGVPHSGNLLSSIIKDVVPRYWTMKGFRVERVWGWDCHGLPAEVFTEKKLGIVDKRDIGTKISLEQYINTCRANMVQTGNLWEQTIDRIGRWVDFQGAYKTMDKEYMESVWWAFKTLFEKGKIYEGEKVLLFCTRDATPISKSEVAMDNSYQEVTDPSVYVKFRLAGQDLDLKVEKPLEPVETENINKQNSPVYLLAWTTTPWTLNANTAVAVNKNISYAEVELNGERLILAEKLVAKTLTDEKHNPLDYKILRTFLGEDLVGRSYFPLFADRGEGAHKVWHADFVHDEEGTGIAHEAPSYGEDDYILGKACGFPMVLDTDEEGFYVEGPWKGLQIWEHNKQIAKDLHSSGVVLKIDYIRHEYPHCHRCGTKLQYRAHPSWFMNIDDQRAEMIEQNKPIDWFPKHIKDGRFKNTIESAPDWNLSRDRFWATAMPVWKGLDKDGKELIKVIGSYAELEELSGVVLEDYHRPWIDDVTFEIDGVAYKRIDKVLDCWFESGSMPFAQFHYPFENIQKFEDNFPGDFIVEYIAQVRAWFYYLHVISVGLFDKPAFVHVIATGTIAGNDGRKMSKSLGNFTDPNVLLDEYSADAFRCLLIGSPVLHAEDFILLDKDVADVQRKLNTLRSTLEFFLLYAEADSWVVEPSVLQNTLNSTQVLDIWIQARLNILQKEIEGAMESYDLPLAIKPIFEFIDELSNWYVRRSRKRFWKSENDDDKQQAYLTLYFVLCRVSVLIAPFAPFLAEDIYKTLTGNDSVHLTDWPLRGEEDNTSTIILVQMSQIRELITEGLAQRAVAKIKVRQPLRSATIEGDCDFNEQLLEIIAEELNVKKVFIKKGPDDRARQNQDVSAARSGNLNNLKISLDLKLDDQLLSEGYMRELIRYIQSARKIAGLQVSDRIRLNLKGSTELRQVIDYFSKEIMQETLSVDFEPITGEKFSQVVKINETELTISFVKMFTDKV